MNNDDKDLEKFEEEPLSEEELEPIEEIPEEIEYLQPDEYNEETPKNSNEDKYHNSKYYKERQEELDQKVSNAKKNANETVKSDGTNTVSKNKLDRLKDRTNLLNAQRESFGNKVNGMTSKAHEIAHPIETLKKDVKEKGQEALKSAGNKVKEETKKGTAKVIKFIISKIPIWVWLALGGAFLLFLLIILFSFVLDDDSSNKYMGLLGYEYYPGACEEVLYDGEFIPLEQYIAGAIAGETTSFADEALKVQAVASRTFLVQHATPKEKNDGCYYEHIQGVKGSLNYAPQKMNERHINAANETKGIIVLHNGAPRAYYDASSVYTAEQARELDPEGNYSDKYYYIKYGGWVLDGVHFQPFELEKMETVTGQSAVYYLQYALNGQPGYGNHGGGISQNGAGYLAQIEGYDWKQIIHYYYNGEEELRSIYRSLGYSGEFALDPNSEAYSGLRFLTDESLENLLAKNGSSITEFNEYLSNIVNKSGAGTREAVVNVAVSLIGSLAEMGYKLPYQWGGKYYSIGARGSWGTPSSTNCQSYANAGYDSGVCYTNYRWSAFDCSGFVNWALVNGFQFNNYNELSAAGVYQTTTLTGTIPLDPNKAVCEPGDVLANEGHIVLIVGLDNENKNYIIAESTGSRLNTGYGGLKLTNYSYGDRNYGCRSLQNLYDKYGVKNEK